MSWMGRASSRNMCECRRADMGVPSTGQTRSELQTRCSPLPSVNESCLDLLALPTTCPPANTQATYGQLQRTLDCFDHCVVLLDVSCEGWRVLHVNAAWAKMTGRDSGGAPSPRPPLSVGATDRLPRVATLHTAHRPCVIDVVARVCMHVRARQAWSGLWWWASC